MSTERIVNRFPPTAGLEADLAELDQAEQIADEVLTEAKTKIDDPIEFDHTLAAFLTGPPEPPGDDRGNLSSPKTQEDSQQCNSQDAVLNEIAALRSQVVKALKHLGVDTRKFFGV